jgi:hypothetical protein
MDFNGPVECRFCSTSGSALLTARHLLSTSNWEFFYCFKCKNWFKISEEGQSGEICLVRDKKLVTALEYFTQSQEMFQPIDKRKKKNFRSILGRITFAIYDLISPYLSED